MRPIKIKCSEDLTLLHKHANFSRTGAVARPMAMRGQKNMPVWTENSHSVYWWQHCCEVSLVDNASFMRLKDIVSHRCSYSRYVLSQTWWGTILFLLYHEARAQLSAKRQLVPKCPTITNVVPIYIITSVQGALSHMLPQIASVLCQQRILSYPIARCFNVTYRKSG